MASTDLYGNTVLHSTPYFSGIVAFYWILVIAFTVLSIVSEWKIFVKAGKPGWAALIPVYNMVVMFEIVGMSPWLVILLFIPIANIVVLILTYIKLAEKFGKGAGYAVGLVLLGCVFLPMLAFGKAEYKA
ncbi:MAG: DUF5684 domain-containing protein [Clostridia bacterium]